MQKYFIERKKKKKREKEERKKKRMVIIAKDLGERCMPSPVICRSLELRVPVMPTSVCVARIAEICMVAGHP